MPEVLKRQGYAVILRDRPTAGEGNTTRLAMEKKHRLGLLSAYTAHYTHWLYSRWLSASRKNDEKCLPTAICRAVKTFHNVESALFLVAAECSQEQLIYLLASEVGLFMHTKYLARNICFFLVFSSAELIA